MAGYNSYILVGVNAFIYYDENKEHLHEGLTIWPEIPIASGIERITFSLGDKNG